jgi:hypothetical protein
MIDTGFPSLRAIPPFQSGKDQGNLFLSEKNDLTLLRNSDEINLQFCAETFCQDKEEKRRIAGYLTIFLTQYG